MCTHRGLLSCSSPLMKEDCLWHVWCNSTYINSQSSTRLSWVCLQEERRWWKVSFSLTVLLLPEISFLFIALVCHVAPASSYPVNFPHRWRSNPGVIFTRKPLKSKAGGIVHIWRHCGQFVHLEICPFVWYIVLNRHWFMWVAYLCLYNNIH